MSQDSSTQAPTTQAPTTEARRLTDASSPAALRRMGLLDRAIVQLDHALRTTFSEGIEAARGNPAARVEDGTLDEADRRHAAGLMRVNHAGEVCAQALYLGQAAVARDAATRAALLHAAHEEGDHLAWCGARLTELGSRPSLLNPLWYAGSYAIGAAAGLAGDGYNLGFVVETERQVEAHLGEHLQRLPAPDQRSRAIVRQMQADEVAHGQAAQQAGARALPAPVPTMMRLASAVMKVLAYRF